MTEQLNLDVTEKLFVIFPTGTLALYIGRLVLHKSRGKEFPRIFHMLKHFTLMYNILLEN